MEWWSARGLVLLVTPQALSCTKTDVVCSGAQCGSLTKLPHGAFPIADLPKAPDQEEKQAAPALQAAPAVHNHHVTPEKLELVLTAVFGDSADGDGFRPPQHSMGPE